ncbi:MAG: hypothetical protein KAV42_01785 [Candidatus Krumholzibacteria bacterium]|nr:hypothetical protein [Candidatus Krumholzibacteria bacterium]
MKTLININILLVTALILFCSDLRASATDTAVPPAVSVKLDRTHLRYAYRQQVLRVLGSDETRVDLGRSFLIPGSDSVWVDGRLLERETDYRINILRGSITLVSPPVGGELFRATWSRYPFSFAPVFAARFPGEKTGPVVDLPDAVGPGSDTGKQVNPYKLHLSGSKTVGFSVGSSRGLGIDQSMKVTMTGKLARDLEVKAFLTDDNLPVQPEGNTEELKYLDKIYVQINSRHMEARLGDFPTGLEWSGFSRFQRELRGASIKVDVGEQEFTVGGGIARGRFKTAEFRGRDGVQGPYELLSARRFNGIIILPGSESVLLDGREMKRGNENDFTIDYVRGTITFTEKNTISIDSEIVVDYQMGEDDYERTTVTAGWSAPFFDKAVRLRTFFFREGDSSGKPIRGGLTKEEMAVLEVAGDDAGSAVTNGVEEVEDAEDAYILIPAGTLPEYFQFVETGGQYRLSFHETRPGEGDYEPDGFTKRGEVRYRYVGTGSGSFIIGRPLPLPETKQVFSVGLEAGKGVFYLDGEGDVSLYDRNTLSGLDDDDNMGGAMRVGGGIRGFSMPMGRLDLRGEYSMLEERFAPADKARSSYFYRNWNLEDVPLEGKEEISGGSIFWKGDSLWDIGGSYRRLARGDSLSAVRSDFSANIGDLRGRGVSIKAFDSRTGDDRDRRSAEVDASFSFWHLAPRFRFDTERYRAFDQAVADTGRYYYENSFGLAGRGLGGYRADLSLVTRRTDLMSAAGAIWSRARETDEIRLDAGYSGGSRILDLFISHRTTRDALGGESKHDLARIRYREVLRSSGITSDIGYRISSGEDRRLEKTVIYVGENEGDYDEEGREVGQKRGDYMVLYLPGSEVEAVRTVELTWRMSYGNGIRGISSGSRGTGILGVIRRNLSLDQFVSVLEKSGTDELLRLYLLDPDILQRDDLTLYGKNSLRQEWSLLNDVSRYDLKFVIFREDEEDNRSGDVSTSRYNREMEVQVEAATSSGLSFTLEAGTRLRERESGDQASQRYRVESLSSVLITGYRLRPSVKMSMELGTENRKDAVSGAGQTSWSVTPAVNASLGKKVNLTSMLKFTYTTIDAGQTKPLFFLEEGMREDWNVIGQYRFTRNLSFGLNYNGRREKDYVGEVKTVHALKMECRAFF